MAVKVKICGVTLPEQAREIATLGADYIGCIVEFPKSPRSISRVRARELHDALKGSRATLVGVTVDMPIEMLFEIIKFVDLKIVQLHGSESIEYVNRLKERGIEVWKVIREHTPHPARQDTPLKRGIELVPSNGGVAEGQGGFDIRSVDKIVVDAKHPLHGAGGSGKLSDWNSAKQLVDEGYSVVLSGGLTPENVQRGIKSVRPHIVDVSSGVEIRPGVKDILKVKDIIRNAKVL